MPIRIFEQRLEYGFWQVYTDWNRLDGYMIDADKNGVVIRRSGVLFKHVRVGFADVADLNIFGDVLKEKKIKSVV